MFGEMTNDMRAHTAAVAIDAFQRETRTDIEDALPDLLCNLMHYAIENGIDFEAVLNRGAYHFQAEVEIEESCAADMAQSPENPHHYVKTPGAKF